MKSVIWNIEIFENNFGLIQNFTKYLNKKSRLGTDLNPSNIFLKMLLSERNYQNCKSCFGMKGLKSNPRKNVALWKKIFKS